MLLLASALALTATSHAGTDGDPTPDVCTTIPDTHRRFKPRAGDLALGEGGGWPKKELKRLPGPLVERIKEHKKTFKTYPAALQQALMDGELRPGLDEVAATIAWGPPDYTWDLEGRRCQALLYTEVGTAAALVTSCDGAMTGLYDLESAVDCTRLDAIDARLSKNRRWFRALDLDQQTAAVVGLPQGWMGVDDLEVVFGKPARKESSDELLVFHDDSGYYEGLVVEVQDGQAVRFSVPDEQMFTRQGRRQYRKDERKAARQEAREQWQEERRRLVAQAILITAVAVAAEAAAHAEQQAAGGPGSDGYSSDGYSSDGYSSDSYGSDSYGSDSYGSDSYGSDSYGSGSSSSGSYGSGGSSGDGVQVTQQQTYVPPPQGDPNGRHVLRGWCQAVFQFEADLRISGGGYSARYTLKPLPNVSGEPRSGQASGAVVQEGDQITLVGFAAGSINIADQLILTLSSPFECAGQQVIHER